MRSSSRARSAYERQPAVAGTFYPSSPDVLGRDVERYLADAPETALRGSLRGLITPHAGYVYSGGVAASAIRQLRGRRYDTVVLLGPSHHFRFDGVAVHAKGSFSTPLGTVPVDEALAAELVASDPAILDRPDVHAPEHGLEVQLPFLQSVLPPFSIVPIVMFDFSERNCRMLADALTHAVEGRDALVLVTTDLAHYPAYEDAVESDTAMIVAIESFEPAEIRARSDAYLARSIPNLQVTMCGMGAVVTGVEVAKRIGATGVQSLQYANSGDVPSGGKSQVVGYVGAAFFDEREGEVSG